MFVPNNQVPVQTTQPVAPVQTQIPVEQAPVAQPVSATVSAAPTGPGALEKFFTRLARFLAKITGQPDPIT